uniref:Uncharacterized protein n=1 Tax=Anguilla anguilla TaxID=7936 RepID=A0A0E9VKH4_ANGAN
MCGIKYYIRQCTSFYLNTVNFIAVQVL